MNNYYKIKIKRDDNSVRCWLGDAHGKLHCVIEKFSLILSETAIESEDIKEYLGDKEWELVPVDRSKYKDQFIIDDVYYEFNN